MPARRTATTRSGDGNSQTNMYLGAAIFRQLTTAQLQELCRRNGLSALGRRTTLEDRLKNAGIVSAAVPLVFPFNSARIPTHSRRSKSPKSSDWFKIPLQPQPETSPLRLLVQLLEFCSHRHRLLHR